MARREMAKEKSFSEKLDEYLSKQGMTDKDRRRISLESTGTYFDWGCLQGKKDVVLYLHKRRNKDGRGEYYARIYIPK